MNDKIFNTKDKWLEIVYQALINLNGAGKYESIYDEVLSNKIILHTIFKAYLL